MEYSRRPAVIHRTTTTLLATAALAAISATGADAVTINFGSSIQPGMQHFLSNGTEIPVAPDGSSGFFFQVGTFTGGFTPTAVNTDSWLANWSPVTTPAGAVLPDAEVEYTTHATAFSPVGAFTASFDLTHNNAPFSIGAQAYIWGYNTRTAPGDAEWILITNSATWQFPNSGFGSPVTWSVGNAATAETVVGSITGDSMQLGQVTIPGPVPEPSPAALALAAAATAGALRRRRPTSRTP